MSVVDLHPDQLFDALRAGKLTAGERIRLEAHCTRCTACMFELRWVEASPAAQPPSAEDCAYADAAFESLFLGRAHGARVSVAKPRFGWKLPVVVGGLLLAVGASLGWYFTRPGQGAPPAVTTASLQQAQPQSRPLSPPPEAAPEAKPDAIRNEPVATRPSANQLLAAARRAQSHAQIDRAEQLYSQVINGYAATPAAGAAQIALGRLLFERQPFEAVTLFDGYLRRRPSGTLAEEALFYRALSLEKLGESQTASASLRELLKRFPKSLYAEPARARLAMSKSVE